MKTEKAIKSKILEIEKDYGHVLTGSLATIEINAPRALSQVDAVARLIALNWVIDKEYKIKLKGTN